MDRINRILQRIRLVISDLKPDIFVMEDYSGGANINTMIPLVELGGCLKMMIHELGYRIGRDVMMRGDKLFIIQAATSMKKFVLGHGNVTKDTSYLLKIHQRLHVAFDNDNEADAYMHAIMAGLVYKVARGEVPIGNLTATQQEALISRGLKKRKGLSMSKAMKLPDSEKVALAGF
jgi:Holliday junction resolvasome RuvABC endonuclease subunit